MSRDVFEKYPLRLAFTDDAGNVWPQVAWVVFAPSLSGRAERLARVSSQNGVNDPEPWSGDKGSEIGPYRCRVEVSGAHPRFEDAARVFFPFDVADGGKARLGKPKAHVKATAACT